MKKATEKFEEFTNKILTDNLHNKKGRYIKITTDKGIFTGIIEFCYPDRIEMEIKVYVNFSSIKEMIHYENLGEIPINERFKDIDLIEKNNRHRNDQ